MKLPVGIQTFSEIQENGYLYIDKTKQIYEALNGGKYYFLSRPRRFGKSLLVSTLKSLYKGRKDLFKDLWVEDKWNWEEQLPVIHVQFASQGVHSLGLEKAIEQMVRRLAKELNISLEAQNYSTLFKELIYKAAQQSPTGKTVLLIDEYDKPIIDYLDDIPQAQTNRKVLKGFYSVLKDSDPYLELVFITGVSRFVRTSIFSDLNNLKNLTMNKDIADLVGFTYEEVATHFTEQMHFLANKKGISFEELEEQVRYWYNGYSWDGETKVYNPFSLLNFMQHGQIQNFWFETGTPTFLVEALRERKLYNIDKIRASDSLLDSFDIENLNTVAILFQTGYLTIKEELALGMYTLEYPNNEVRISMEEYLLNAFSHDPFGQGKVRAYDIAMALRDDDVKEVVEIINATFANLPYDLWQSDNEAFYHALIHLTFSLTGAYIQSEIHSSKGRLDSKVETADTIYIFEFKLDKTTDEAIQQIRDKNYFGPYLSGSKKRIGVGINFSKAQKAIETYQVVEF